MAAGVQLQRLFFVCMHCEQRLLQIDNTSTHFTFTVTVSGDLRSAMSSRWLPRSLTLHELKRNPALIPLLAFTAAGGLWATYYLYRLAAKSPEVMWNRHKNPEPWNEYENKQYKFYSTIDHSKLESQRPKF